MDTDTFATQAQLDWMKQTMRDYQLHNGHFARLWTIISTHEADVRNPVGAERMSAETADKTVEWLLRQVSLVEGNQLNRYPESTDGEYPVSWFCDDPEHDYHRLCTNPDCHCHCHDRRQLPVTRVDQTADAVNVPAGNYAVPDHREAGNLSFWQVIRPVTGHRAGDVIVRNLVYGRPALEVAGSRKWDVLKLIAATGPQAAAQKFDQEFGK